MMVLANSALVLLQSPEMEDEAFLRLSLRHFDIPQSVKKSARAFCTSTLASPGICSLDLHEGMAIIPAIGTLAVSKSRK